MYTAENAFDLFEGQAPDPKVPTWDGTGGAVGLEAYALLSAAFQASTEDSKLPLCGPRLWANLRGEAKRHVMNIDQATLRVVAGVQVLLTNLKTSYPETQLKRLPRHYRALFKEVTYVQGQPVAPALAAFERA